MTPYDRLLMIETARGVQRLLEVSAFRDKDKALLDAAGQSGALSAVADRVAMNGSDYTDRPSCYDLFVRVVTLCIVSFTLGFVIRGWGI